MMQKKFTAIIVVFALFLLLPFGIQAVSDLKGDKRFLCFDIFKDVAYTPIKREMDIAAKADSLEGLWRSAREAMAAGDDVADALEPVVGALSDLETAVLTVNAYAELDSDEADYKALKNADTLLQSLEDNPESFPAVDSALKSLIRDVGQFSLVRAFMDVKHHGFWTGRYLRDFEHKVENENALVLSVRPQYQRAVWNVFSDPGEKVVLGRMPGADTSDSWLFYRQDVEFLVNPSPLDIRSAKLDNPVQAITKFRDQLKAKGVELLVVIVPGKPSIYPENLTGIESGIQVPGHGKIILDSLEKLGFNTVDLYTPLWNAKNQDAQTGALYLNDDTHWTPRGAELAAQVIAQRVSEMVAAGIVDIGMDSIEFVTRDSIANRMGDVGEMSGLNKFGTFHVQPVTGHVVMQQQVTVRDSATSDTTVVPFKDDFRKAKILILGDSFSRIYQTDSPVNAGWIAHFARNMKRPVASIVSDGGASTLVREKLARKSGVLKGKKLLIWEFVERDLRYGAEGWKDVEL